ncbi:MAG: RluA family pseudouridine synthase [Gemmataceae bacterium]|nr:RluA family pseudouridine synthase [Gemmataceae bacterium]
MIEPAAPANPVILFEDNHCLAVAKPAGLLTQAPPGVPSLEAQVKAYLKGRYQKAGQVYLGIPHRLDRPVSGVVLFARQTRSAQRLAEQFQTRQVVKVYWAAVEGEVQPEEGVWEDWLRKLPEQARAERAEPGEPDARHALLSYRRLAPCAGGTLLELRPRTGRMHQLRVQAALRGWPIRGDALYGATLPFGPPCQAASLAEAAQPAGRLRSLGGAGSLAGDLPRDRAIALHARSLTFLHPIRYEALTVTAPLPPSWLDLVREDEIPG